MKRRKDISLWVALILAALLLFASFLAPWFAPNDPYATNVARIREAPSQDFPFGTDAMGRCVLSRVLYGARTSVFATLALVLCTAGIGTFVGVICGYYGGIFDAVVMRALDGIMAFPEMILAIAVAGILGGGMGNAMLALGFSSWGAYARLARSRVMSIKKEEFVQAAQLSGNSNGRIMINTIFPNIFSSILTYASTQIGSTMLGFAGLSFLNLGVQLPQAEWGSMISEARGMLGTAPWAVFFPAAALVSAVMIGNFLGDVLRDRLNILEPGRLDA